MIVGPLLGNVTVNCVSKVSVLTLPKLGLGEVA